jgi:hypothetical protein
MDGGIDAAYLDFFGREIQMRLRQQILQYHHGEVTTRIVGIGRRRGLYLLPGWSDG